MSLTPGSHRWVHLGMAATQKYRTVVYFDPAEIEGLKKLSVATGAPVAELVRRAVAEYLKRRRRKGKQ
jgi:ribbon-helix-helix protein